MANWANLIVRMVARRAIFKTLRSIFRNFKPKKNRKQRNNASKPIDETPPLNYYKIALQILLLIFFAVVFYLIIEKKITF